MTTTDMPMIAEYVQQGAVTIYIDKINQIICKMHGIIDNKMLYQLIHNLQTIIGCKVLKESPLAFEEACVLAE